MRLRILGVYCPVRLRILGVYCPVRLRILGVYCPVRLRILGVYCPVRLRLLGVYCPVRLRLLASHPAGAALRWDQKPNLLGRPVQDPLMHLCEACSLPVLIYGRMVSIYMLYNYTVETPIMDTLRSGQPLRWGQPLTMDRRPVPTVSIFWRFHCIYRVIVRGCGHLLCLLLICRSVVVMPSAETVPRRLGVCALAARRRNRPSRRRPWATSTSAPTEEGGEGGGGGEGGARQLYLEPCLCLSVLPGTTTRGVGVATFPREISKPTSLIVTRTSLPSLPLPLALRGSASPRRTPSPPSPCRPSSP